MTPAVVAAEIRRCAAAGMTPPRHVEMDEDGLTVREWLHALAGYRPAELHAAMSAYLVSGRYWPRPADIVAQIHELRRARAMQQGAASPRAAYGEWRRTGMASALPCPICGAILQCTGCGRAATTSCGCVARVAVHHDGRLHRDADVPYAGPRSAT